MAEVVVSTVTGADIIPAPARCPRHLWVINRKTGVCPECGWNPRKTGRRP